MLSRIGPIVVLAIVLALAIAFITRYSPAEARGFCLFCSTAAAHRAAPAYDPNFCVGVIKGFSELHAKDLDTFILSIPESKRPQARRCIEDKK